MTQEDKQMKMMEKAVELAETHGVDFDACVEALLTHQGDLAKVLLQLKQ